MGNCLNSRSRPTIVVHERPPPTVTVSPANVGESVGSTRRSETDQLLPSAHVRPFPLRLLQDATDGFDLDKYIGEGGFGYVYKGWIDPQRLTVTRPNSGMAVAIKKFSPGGSQGHREWLSEVNYLGQLVHPNLVKLVGYCHEEDNRLLVYEYMPRGSLEDHLFENAREPLPWSTRVKIALDVARGLNFLHESEPSIIFRDFKTSNILLDSDFTAKLSDFGLAREGPANGQTHVSTDIMGTKGYVAPEYVQTGRLTTKCDVYSFGVVLLELVSGRRVIDESKRGDECHLVCWVKPYVRSQSGLSRVVDSKLMEHYSQDAVYVITVLAMHCTGEPMHRPTMAEVISVLQRLCIEDIKIASSPTSSSWNCASTSSPSPFTADETPVGSPYER